MSVLTSPFLSPHFNLTFLASFSLDDSYITGIDQRLANFFCREKIVNILGFVGLQSLAVPAQLCHCDTKAAMENI